MKKEKKKKKIKSPKLKFVKKTSGFLENTDSELQNLDMTAACFF